MEPTTTSTEVAAPTLISYREIIPAVLSLVGKAMLMAFIALLVMLAGCLIIIVCGTAIGVAAIVSGMSGWSIDFLIPVAILLLAIITWWHVFSAQMAMVRSILLGQDIQGYFISLRYVYKHWWRLIILVISAQILIAAGFMLFFIPGAVAAVYLGFALYSFMTETPRVRMAFARSILLVHGRFWPIVGRYAFLLLAAMSLLLVSVILGLMMPLFFMGVILAFFVVALEGVVIFRSLQTIEPLRAEVPVTLSKSQTVAGAILVLLGLVGLIIMSILSEDPNQTSKSSDTNLQEVYEDATLAGQVSTIRNLHQTLIAENLTNEDNQSGYNGICSEKGSASTLIKSLKDLNDKETLDCLAKKDTFVFEIMLKNGDFLCLDSNGTFGTFYTPRVAPELCNTEPR